MKTLLMVEDERDILENNRRFFMAEGYRVLTAESLAEARECLSRETPGGGPSVDGIVLDIMLPDGNGLDLLSELRGLGNNTPIIMLTAWGKSSDVARGLKLGANDYVSKPFTYEVLLARVETMFRNVEQMPERIERGALYLNISSTQAFLNGTDMLLTQKEFALLLLFVQNEGRVLRGEYLYEKVWHSPMNKDSQALRRHISSLRQKFKDGNFPYDISVIYGEGYKFEK